MILSHLNIHALRNLGHVEISLSPGLNYLIGPNGSGKTSILEAVYLLGLGRSFRAAQLNRAIQHNANELSVFAEMIAKENPAVISKLGFARAQTGKSRIKRNGEAVDSIAELAQQLPLLLLYAESYALFRDSPKARRKWLDWGMFHVEHSFFALWRKAQKVLAHRNALLKQMAPDIDVRVWDAQLVEVAQEIHRLRAAFILQWQQVLQEVLEALFNRADLSLSYMPGWDVELGLEQVLKHNLAKDRARGYTSRGPQRADIQIVIENTLAQHVLSLGQQKLLVSGIILSQAVLLRTLSNKNPLILIDDLPAELDEQAREKIAHIIHKLDSQIILTAVDHHTLTPFLATDCPIKMFHVEHGIVSESEFT